jgi:hypothetical protein
MCTIKTKILLKGYKQLVGLVPREIPERPGRKAIRDRRDQQDLRVTSAQRDLKVYRER